MDKLDKRELKKFENIWLETDEVEKFLINVD